MTERRYSDDEVAQILKRAVDAQSRRIASGPDAGVTLAELKTIGSEVGIDPGQIESAALSLGEADLGEVRKLGLPVSFVAERIVETPLENVALRPMLDLIENHRGKGRVEELLGGIEWAGAGPWALSAHHISIQPDDRGTRIRVIGNHTGNAWGVPLLGAVVGGAGGAAAAIAVGAAGAVVVGAGIVAAGALATGAGKWWRRFWRRDVESLNEMLNDLARLPGERKRNNQLENDTRE